MVERTPGDALEQLKDGNARYVAGTSLSDRFQPSVAEANSGKRPFAVVLGCSDARVPVEIVFDQPPGKIFVVRLAGNFVCDAGIASIEFAVLALQAKLIVVLGHEDCGAVAAALAFVREGREHTGHIQRLAEEIAPAVLASRAEPGDWYENAIARNVELNVGAMTAQSTIVSEAVERGDVKVVGGIYSLRTGHVAFS